MNLLSLVGPWLDNICQIRRKWYYSSGWNFLQSKQGPREKNKGQEKKQVIHGSRTSSVVVAVTVYVRYYYLDRSKCLLPFYLSLFLSLLARSLLSCCLSNNAAPSLNKCVCIHPLSTPQLAITPSSPSPHSPICRSPSNHGVFFLPEISPCSFSRLLLATRVHGALVSAASCMRYQNHRPGSKEGITGRDQRYRSPVSDLAA
jgi:hypothetical protein